MKDVIIYTDGACRGNPGPGGWGALIKFENAQKEIFGGQNNVTNNQMELSAAIEGLSTLKEPCKVKLFTDSKYVMDGITQWIQNWKKNNWKTAAKKEVFGQVGIDMVAGPSEVSIIADKNSNANWIASDLIAQAAHDVLAQSILISNNRNFIKSVKLCLESQLKDLPKKNIASKSIKNYGLAIYANSTKKISEIVNLIAPEHLEISFSKSKDLIKKIKNAGSIFIGKFSPEAMGDYIAGPNHVLPTSGSAKFSSGLSVNDFLKRHSLIKITKTGIERLGPSVINLSQHENLEGHARSVKIRLKKDL